jgi:branched-chain amino acid aminotransferase
MSLSVASTTFPINATPVSRINEVDFEHLKFGQHFADHMVVADYYDGQWQDLRIVPYGPLEMMPAMSSLHYGQAIFEGLKAYRSAEGEVNIFRPHENFSRFNESALRMCMPAVTEEMFINALRVLVDMDRAWVPGADGSSLYIRPFMYATDSFVGVRPSETYRFVIFCCPVGAYYSEPVKVKVERHYTRAAEGGTGFAKCAGNYAGAMLPSKLAQQEGYHQLLWTDHVEHEYIEESGTMNVMFVIDGKLVTPQLGTSVLSGITRDSILKIARHWGMQVEERRVSVTEVIEANQTGRLQEAFGAGTAATIAAIKAISCDGIDHELPAIETREFSAKVRKYMDDLKYGRIADEHGWNLTV